MCAMIKFIALCFRKCTHNGSFTDHVDKKIIIIFPGKYADNDCRMSTRIYQKKETRGILQKW